MEQREIKFRVWDTANDRMVDEPYKFHPINEYQKNTYQWKGDHVFYENWQDVDDGIDRPCFLMQYTGLKDKNGVEVYEGDIFDREDDDDYYGLVEWDVDHWAINWGNNYKEPFSDYHINGFLIIGNRFQNPSLLSQ